MIDVHPCHSLLAGLVCMIAFAPIRARADEWSGIVGAYAAYANESCDRVAAVLADCRRCGAPAPAAYGALLRAFCRERSGEADASAHYQELATLYPNTEIAEQALLRVVTLARTTPEPAPSGPPKPGAMESMPRFRAQPVYPEHLRRAKVEGWVLLGFDVLPDGRISDAHVIESSPPYVFDLAAMNSLTRWYYPPHERERLRVRLQFAIER